MKTDQSSLILVADLPSYLNSSSTLMSIHPWTITYIGDLLFAHLVRSTNGRHLYPNLSYFFKRSFLITITFLTVISSSHISRSFIYHNYDCVSINGELYFHMGRTKPALRTLILFRERHMISIVDLKFKLKTPYLDEWRLDFRLGFT